MQEIGAWMGDRGFEVIAVRRETAAQVATNSRLDEQWRNEFAAGHEAAAA
jgi:hypothetical protein